jgi:hypothetical protein
MFKELFLEIYESDVKFPQYTDITEKKDLFTTYDKQDIRKLLKANLSGNGLDAHDNNVDYAPAETNRYFVLVDKSDNPVAIVDSKQTMKDAKKFDFYVEEYGKPVLYSNLTLPKIQKMLKEKFNTGWGPLFKVRYGK